MKRKVVFFLLLLVVPVTTAFLLFLSFPEQITTYIRWVMEEKMGREVTREGLIASIVGLSLFSLFGSMIFFMIWGKSKREEEEAEKKLQELIDSRNEELLRRLKQQDENLSETRELYQEWLLGPAPTSESGTAQEREPLTAFIERIVERKVIEGVQDLTNLVSLIKDFVVALQKTIQEQGKTTEQGFLQVYDTRDMFMTRVQETMEKNNKATLHTIKMELAKTEDASKQAAETSRESTVICKKILAAIDMISTDEIQKLSGHVHGSLARIDGVCANIDAARSLMEALGRGMVMGRSGNNHLNPENYPPDMPTMGPQDLNESSLDTQVEQPSVSKDGE